ncbi:MAG TPA: hypothetical protein VKA15_15455 [Isosphaeraceae bacterium]|nr:hypothetical protein [Isosphaeraceae bacterium]
MSTSPTTLWFDQHGIDFIVLEQGIDTTTPIGRLFSRFLRAEARPSGMPSMMASRSNSARAATWGRTGGRPQADPAAGRVGVAPTIPTLGDRRASGHSIIGLAVFDRSALRAEPLAAAGRRAAYWHGWQTPSCPVRLIRRRISWNRDFVIWSWF